MATTNDITGDSIQTGVVTDTYRNNYDSIFRKKSPKEIEDAKAEDAEFERIRKEFDEKVIMKNEFYE